MKAIIKRANGTRRVFTVNDGPSKTDQSQAKETDVNHIIAKWRKTGQSPTHLAKVQGTYADVSAIPDLNEALNVVTQAQQSFDALPSELRKRFGNSPVEMVNFLKDPKNNEEAISLGLRNKKTSDSFAVEETKPKGAVAPAKTKLSSKPSPTLDDPNDDD